MSVVEQHGDSTMADHSSGHTSDVANMPGEAESTWILSKKNLAPNFGRKQPATSE
jgi:hypothetical protein